MRLASAVKLKKQLQQYQKAKNPQRQSSSNQIDHKTFHHQNEILQNQERPNYHTPTLPSCKNKQITDEHPELSGSPPNDVGVSFNHIRQSLSSFREPRKRFAHECPCALLLYSLVFNHFHLEGIQSKLPEIQRIDRQIIKALKTVLEGKVNENEPGEEISDGKAGLLLCLIEDISLTVKQKQLSLKAIISKISSETIKAILTSMEHLRMRESTHQQAGLGLWSKGNEPSEREGAAWKKVIDCFGKAFALQVSVTDIEGKTRLGASQSYVKVSMRRPQGEWRFFLRKVSCFELDQQQQQK